ncbi:DUF4956 domain-containing protein [Tenacibaculum sp. 190524A02b]|uniref:DUF4956 domain-containing protein n=2 Tax=Tenacibaculum vairaonense TaxID=3137860 RepID=A0ABP1FCA8_9FLAO
MNINEELFMITCIFLNMLIIFLSIKTKDITEFSKGFFSRTKVLNMVYEKIENIHINEGEALKKDLKERLGIDVINYKIHHIDFLKDTAELTLYYKKTSALIKKETTNTYQTPALNRIKN